jgi:hypothetical protein
MSRKLRIEYPRGGRRIPGDAGHRPAEAERAAESGAAEKATGAGL